MSTVDPTPCGEPHIYIHLAFLVFVFGKASSLLLKVVIQRNISKFASLIYTYTFSYATIRTQFQIL